MKRLIAATMMSVCFAGAAGAQSFRDDDLCFALAQQAVNVVNMRQAGATEEYVISQTNVSGYAGKVSILIAHWVFTFDPDAKYARKMTYLRCKAGEFEPERVANVD